MEVLKVDFKLLSGLHILLTEHAALAGAWLHSLQVPKPSLLPWQQLPLQCDNMYVIDNRGIKTVIVNGKLFFHHSPPCLIRTEVGFLPHKIDPWEIRLVPRVYWFPYFVYYLL